jgi:oligo-1,6-glucosidase
MKAALLPVKWVNRIVIGVKWKQKMSIIRKAWWKEAVVYQIYPKSFQDSNGDGIGDLPGILQRLNYITKLGATVIWLCPVYESPNCDNGYDISNYQKIMAEYGSMEEFDELLHAAHERGLKVILDLVVNHTSDEHPWFMESRKSKDNPYRDYYIWQESKNGDAPNNWGGCFSGPAWEYDKATDMYYLHLFSKKQPDLNWDNPSLRHSVFDMMTWWLQKGIDGFRLDVISYVSKDFRFPDGEKKNGLYGDFSPYVANGPRVHEYLRQMNREVLSKYDIVTVGETPGVTVEEAQKYAGSHAGELNMVFHFEHMSLDEGEHGKWSNARFKLVNLKTILTKWQKGLNGCGWNSLYWNNHDQPRAVSRFGNDSTPFYRDKSAKMLATCLYMMQGTPFIYQGEELGMTNMAFENLEDYRDIETLNAYQEIVVKQGVDPQMMMEYIHRKSRDNARTPMQWNDSKNAGFTIGDPWIKVNPNYKEINAENAISNPKSIFNYYRNLIQLRKQYEIIVYGNYDLLLPDDPQLYIYTRKLGNRKLLVICNFSNETVCMHMPAGFTGDKKLLIANYETIAQEELLLAYEARVYYVDH